MQFLVERTVRILLPLVFGSFAIVPVHYWIYAEYYSEQFSYTPDVGHLWFLMNIYMYVLWFLALFYFAKEIQNSRFFDFLRRLLERYTFAIYLFALPYVLQALTIPSDIPYALYYDSRVGLLLGGVAFLLGFTLVTLGDAAWRALSRVKYYSLVAAGVLFCIRYVVFDIHGPHVLTAVESISWIFGFLGLGYMYLNRPSKMLKYLSPAAYPVYIVHMIFLYLGAYYIFPLKTSPWVSLVLITAFTFLGSFIVYEVLRRIPFVRLLFGMRNG
jgi:surface polysaccharide O-acyltransferase-like enzyme